MRSCLTFDQSKYQLFIWVHSIENQKRLARMLKVSKNDGYVHQNNNIYWVKEELSQHHVISCEKEV